MPHHDNGSKLIWFLTGAAIGAAIALLYAPQTGAQTRKYLRKKTEEGKEALADTGKELLEKSKEYYEKGRQLAEEAGELLERGKKLVTG
ncbi:MAG: YtxH domain-containing protein [Bryobacteraceae bacterium]